MEKLSDPAISPKCYAKELRAGSPVESSGVTALLQTSQRRKDTKCIPMCEWIRKIFGMTKYYSAVNKRNREACCEVGQPWEHIIQTVMYGDGHQYHWHCCGARDRFTETGGEISYLGLRRKHGLSDGQSTEVKADRRHWLTCKVWCQWANMWPLPKSYILYLDLIKTD